MAEKRMITRDMPESSVMHNLSAANPEFELEAQRVWLSLILIADDHGRGRLIFQNIKIKAFGSTPNRYEKIKVEDIEKWVKEIEDQGAIKIYEVGEDKYFCLTSWEKYQSGKWYPRDSNLPPPTDECYFYPFKDRKIKEKGIKCGSSCPYYDEKSCQTSKVSRDKAPQEKVSKGKSKKKGNGNTRSDKPDLVVDKKELTAWVRELVPLKASTPAQLSKQVVALDKLTGTDRLKMDPERIYTPETWKAEVIAVLRWARADTEPVGSWSGWSKNFQSIPRLRDDGCDKYINIRAAYLSKMRGKKPSGLSDRKNYPETGKTDF